MILALTTQIVGIILILIALPLLSIVGIVLIRTAFSQNKKIKILNREIKNPEKANQCKEDFAKIFYEQADIQSSNYANSVRSLEPINANKASEFYHALMKNYITIHKDFTYRRLDKGCIYERHIKNKKSVLFVIDVKDFAQEKNVHMTEKHIYGADTYNGKASVFCLFEILEKLLKENKLNIGVTVVIKIGSMPLKVLIDEKQQARFDLILVNGGGIFSPITTGLRSHYAFIGTTTTKRIRIRFSINNVSMSYDKIDKFYNELNSTELCPTKYSKKMNKLFNAVGKDMLYVKRMMYTHPLLFSSVLGQAVKEDLITTSASNIAEDVSVALQTKMQCSEIKENKDQYCFDAEFNMALHQTEEQLLEKISKISKKYNINYTVTYRQEAVQMDYKGKWYEKLAKTIVEVAQSVYTSPYVISNSLDVNELKQLGDNIFWFSPLYYSSDALALRNTENERVNVRSLLTAIDFYELLLFNLMED